MLYLASAASRTSRSPRAPTACFTRVVGGGLEAIAVELAERRALTLDHARGWLEHVGLERRPLEDDRGRRRRSSRTPARCSLDGVRRIAGEVRNSLDFHHAQGGGAGVSARVAHGPAAAVVPGLRRPRSAPSSACPSSAGIVEGGAGGVDAAPLHGRRRPGRRGGARHEGRQPDPGRGPSRRRRRQQVRRRRPTPCSARSALLVVLAAACALAGKSVTDKRAQLARVEREAAAAEAQGAGLADYSSLRLAARARACRP